MAAYVIVEVEVTDPVVYEQVKQMTPAVIAQYGGRYLARGGQSDVLEGDWNPKRLVLLQFDSIEQAKRWRSSPEFAEIHTLRLRSAITRMVVLEGLPEGWQP